MRSYTVAGLIFAIHASFVILASIAPFGAIDVLGGYEILPVDLESETQIGGLDIVDMVGSINLFLTLLIGPITVLPLILSGLGITGVLAGTLTTIAWIIYGLALVQIVTGRMLATAR